MQPFRNTAAGPSLLDMPSEILQQIVSEASGDAAALRRVCKAVHACATPVHFSSMTLQFSERSVWTSYRVASGAVLALFPSNRSEPIHYAAHLRELVVMGSSEQSGLAVAAINSTWRISNWMQGRSLWLCFEQSAV